MPSRLKRYQQAEKRHLHYITFTCYHRRPHLGSAEARDRFEKTLERARRWYGFFVAGYVVMPEHAHLLVSEPEKSSLAVALQMLKQISPRRLAGDGRFWQKRYYDFNVSTERKRIEKLRYMHRNPVKRRLVENPEEWKWSSYRYYLTGVEGAVEVESEWTARKRERMGAVPTLKRRG